MSKSVVFDRQPDPVEWHITRNREEYNILTVNTIHTLSSYGMNHMHVDR